MNPAQHLLLNTVVRLHSDEDAWTDSIAGALGIKTRAAYKRLRTLERKGSLRREVHTYPQTSVPRAYWTPLL